MCKLAAVHQHGVPVTATVSTPHRMTLGGSYFVGQDTASHAKYEHRPQEALLSVCTLAWTKNLLLLSLQQMCHSTVWLDHEAWLKDSVSSRS